MSTLKKSLGFGIKNNTIQEVNKKDFDVILDTPNKFFGSHSNLVPLTSNVQGARVFYGARFANQSLPLINREAPLVQNLSDHSKIGESFEDIYGKQAGAFTAKHKGIVTKVTEDEIKYKSIEDGKEVSVPLYNNFMFNRKTSIKSKPVVGVGDEIEPGRVLASSNFTDDNGTLSLGLNARIGLVPYKGYSMDDAVVVSESFAKRLASEHTYNFNQDFDDNIKYGANHFKSLFPTKFDKDKLSLLDDNGIVKKGVVLKKGDPIILATRPKVVSSKGSEGLSKAFKQSRTDASQVWDSADEGKVTDVHFTNKGVKVFIEAIHPARIGDKIVARSGQKGVISKIIPDNEVPRDEEGKPLEVLLNPLGIPSRVNNSLIYELNLGKVAAKTGKAYRIPAFTKKGENRFDYVRNELEKNGLKSTERVYDPKDDRFLEDEITVGNGYILKLHHTGKSKLSNRSQGSYDANEQPTKGGSESAQSKRLSGLETNGLLSAGAYSVLREGSTLKGQQNDEYWRALRSGQTPKSPGRPFVWDKFRALMSGAGINVKDMGKGKLRLTPYTDKTLDEQKPVEVESGDMVNLSTLEPVKGGLFDPAMATSNKWGKISLPTMIPNPAYEETILSILGLTKKEFREILSGNKDLVPDYD